MNAILDSVIAINEKLASGLSVYIKENTLIDPAVGNTVRPHLIAFLLEILENYASLTQICDKDELLKKLLSLQNRNGSWNEIHRNYNYQSSLVTSLCCLSLLRIKDRYSKRLTDLSREAIVNGCKYVNSQITYNFIKKSELNFADILNVGAISAFFFQEAQKQGIYLDLDKDIDNLVHFICRNQKSNGVLPYSSKTVTFPMNYDLNLQTVFYQALTLHYLDRIKIEERWFKESVDRGKKWLRKCVTPSGKIKWRKSHLPFSMYQSNVIPFILTTLIDELETNIQLNLLKRLNKYILNNNTLPTKEPAKIIFLPYNMISSFRILFSGGYPLKHRFFRLGHCFFNEISRCRYKNEDQESSLDFFLPKSTSLPRPFNLPDVAFTVESMKILNEYKNNLKNLEKKL